MTMKSVIRSIKNEINNYDEGERLVRELTSNERTPPSTAMLIKLKIMLTDTHQFPTVVRMLFKRLKDYNNIRHVEKSLICIEYLIKNADRKFVRYCQRDKGSIQKLTRYRYILGNNNGVPVDYGGNIRKRAKRIADLLAKEDKLRAARAKAQGYSMQFKDKKGQKGQKGTHKKNTQKSSRSPQKSSKSSQSRKTTTPPQSTPKKKKVKKKRVKKPKDTISAPPEVPQYESFIDMPPETNNNPSQSNNNAQGGDDLLSGHWWKQEEAQGGGDDEFAWFQADNNADFGNEAGVGDDGGAFGFGNDDEFDKDVDGDNKEDDLNPDSWMMNLTQMDNVLAGDIKKKDINKKNTKGASMAQLAKNNPIKQPIPNAFGTDDFFNQNSSNSNANDANNNNNNNDFDPFGLGNQNNNKATGSSNITSLYNTSSSAKNNPFGTSPNNNGFGYQGKNAMNAYSGDPFAGIGGGQAGPTPAKYVSRQKQSDPFAQFGSMK